MFVADHVSTTLLSYLMTRARVNLCGFKHRAAVGCPALYVLIAVNLSIRAPSLSAQAWLRSGSYLLNPRAERVQLRKNELLARSN